MMKPPPSKPAATSLFGDDPRFGITAGPRAVVTTQELVKALDTYQMQLTRWREELAFPRSIPGRRGHYDALDIIRWLGVQLKSAAGEVTGSIQREDAATESSPMLEEQRKWKAKMLELQYSVAAGKYVALDDYLQAERSRVEATLAVLIRLPAEAQEKLGLSDAQRDQFEGLLRHGVETISSTVQEIGLLEELPPTDPDFDFADDEEEP